jgi:lipopolysaccharide/colanic/teichoic acid biosynthesis glycosyltransferase/GT2 family glycosyltransferase
MIEISVVVPVRNAAATLPACLEALSQQTADAGCYEVIVVNDGSTDNTLQVAAGFDVRCLEIPPSGPAAARNAGAAQARGELVLFTDGDCAPAPDWVAQMSAPFTDPEVVGARGVYRTRQTSLIARFVQQEYQDKYDRTAQRATIDFVDTYSAGYRRAVFQANGGFEAAFSAPSVEDQEFSFRLAEKGYKLVFAPRAAVYHQHDRRLGEYGRRKFWIGYWKTFLLRWHPEKALGDSHTPASQRAQMGLLGLAGLAALGGLAWQPLWWAAGAGLALFYLSALPFFAKLWRRDRPVLLVAPLLLLVRAGALAAGLAAGLFGLAAQRSPRHAAISWPNQLAKRLIDVVGAVAALVIAAPLLAVLVVLIRLDSPGPAFFVQERVGENGKRFRMLKLRSMVAGAGAANVGPKLPDDPRVTRLGRVLRRWSLDEVPQFWNVLVGEMSLVGPRPEETRIVAGYSDWHRARLAVRPGLTGPMQINGRGELPLDERVRLELDYIEHYSLLKDAAILLKTVPAVIRGIGAY